MNETIAFWSMIAGGGWMVAGEKIKAVIASIMDGVQRRPDGATPAPDGSHACPSPTRTAVLLKADELIQYQIDRGDKIGEKLARQAAGQLFQPPASEGSDDATQPAT